MLNGQKIVVVMPAYNAARSLRQTYDEVMAHGIVDLVMVVDDASQDETAAVARKSRNVRRARQWPCRPQKAEQQHLDYLRTT
jgi:glycosyltransferase involved in cell wall biosynthesis